MTPKTQAELKTAAVARYHAGCLRAIGAQNIGLRDLRTTKKAALACDLGVLAGQEGVLSSGGMRIEPPPPPADPEDQRQQAVYLHKLEIWERLRELARKATLEAHNKEVVYGGPLLVGALPRARRVESVLAPLFTQAVEITVEDDGCVEIRSKDEPPRFNPVLWTDALSKSDVEQVFTFGLDAQGDLSNGWDAERVRVLLTAINSVFPALTPQTPEGSLTSWPDRPSPSAMSDSGMRLRLHEGASVHLANRASPYLLADLERIGEEPGPLLLPDRPLSILVNPPSADKQPELRSPDIDEVEFPFPSNDAQRRVADAIAKNKVVVVQGPPGNGKSLTIANLACHLVAQGKSVLIASHKDQALTVVRDKLKETKLQFLYASMIGSSGAAKRELQGQIAEVNVFAASANAQTLRKHLSEIETRRAESGEAYRQLRDEFNERAEREQQEAAALILELEPIATLPAGDPAVIEVEVVADGLTKIDGMARTHRGSWSWLLRTEAADTRDATPATKILGDFLELQRARLEASRNDAVRVLTQQWHARTEADPYEIDRCDISVGEIENAMREPIAGALLDDQAEVTIESASLLANTPELLTDCRDHAALMSKIFGEARSLSDARQFVNADPIRRGEIKAQHADLSRMLKRRKARQWLEENAPGAAGLDGEQMSRWFGFWERWSAIQTLAEGMPGGIRENLGPTYDPERVATLISRANCVVKLAEGVGLARREEQGCRLRLDLTLLLRARSTAEVDTVFANWRTALAALDANRRGEAAKTSGEVAFARDQVVRVDQLLDEGDYAGAENLLAEMTELLSAIEDLSARRRILDGPTGQLTETLATIEQAALSESEAPAFLSDLALGLAVHPKVIRLAELRAARSTRDLAEEVRELRDRVLEDARVLLGLRIQSRIVDGFRSPQFLASLEAFRKAIRAAAKRAEAIEALKNSDAFDISILTDVFPCWIMRPEEACRVFPAEADVFDVVIFDEASQCNPDQTLPLLSRAKRVAIFGDEKQLANEDLKRSLSGPNNQALLRQAGLDELDPTGLFNQTKNSLLGLISARAQASLVLNEHFRCRPELVAFSNKQFYGNGLRIMRDREDDRGLGPPFLLREIAEVPPLGKSKVNPYEAEILVRELEARLDDPRYKDLSFGVLSLFRDQIEHIEELVEARIPRTARERHRIICSTVDGFQGDERDVIFYSWRYTPTTSPSVLSFTNGDAGAQRTNVALTRARHQSVHFISAPVERFPQGSRNVTGFLQHAAKPDYLMAEAESRIHHEPIDELRKRAAEQLRQAGLLVKERYLAGGVSVDMKVEDPETNARAAVFVDSELDPHPPATIVRRIDGQGLLERAGWKVLRIPATDFCTPDPIASWIRSQLAGTKSNAAGASLEAEYVKVLCPRLDDDDEELRLASPIAVEDRADFDWESASVGDRLRSGDDVFQSDFERELYDRLAANPDLQAVPQWPSRDKRIDLVITDREGRRLAIEADGDAFHQGFDSNPIPEDINRQELLEEVGWVFHRILHSRFIADPDAAVAEILEALAEQPPNPDLARKVWDEAVEQPLPSAQVLPQAGKELNLGHTDGNFEADNIERMQEPGSETVESAPQESIDLQPDSTSPDDTSTSSLDGVPLDDIARMLLEGVRDQGEVSDDDLELIFAAKGIVVPNSRRRLLKSFAGSLKARKFLERPDTDKSWQVGRRSGDPPEFCGLSIDGIAEDARQQMSASVDEENLFNHMLDRIGQSRDLPMPYKRAVGAGVWKATHGRQGHSR